MNTELAERTVMPPDEPIGELADLLRRHPVRRAAELSTVTGERFVVPGEVLDVLRLVVEAMAKGQAITVAPHNQTLGTQEAAHLLGVSRPTLVRLLESGELPYERPGRHRRVLLRDVLEYQDQRRHRRRKALRELVETSEEGDLYTLTAEPVQTR